jgi:predicted PurR-regulated permease PerM
VNWFDIDPKYVKICVYASVTMLVTMALGILLLNSGGLFGKAWELITAVGEPFVYGMLICYLLLPTVRRMTDWLQARGIFPDSIVHRLNIAVALTVSGVALLVLSITFVLVLVITRSFDSVNLATIRELWNSAEGDIMGLIQVFRNALEEFGLVSPEGSTTIMGTFGEVTGVFSKVVFSIVFGVYFLLDGARVFQYAKRVFVAVFGEYLGPDLTVFLKDADDAFSGYIRGQFVDAVIVGVLVAISFTIIGVPYGPIIGLLTGIGNLIPYLGGPVGYITTIMVCLAEGSAARLLGGVIVLSVIMFVDANILNPRLLSHSVEVHPLVVVMALLAGSAMGGLAGMLIAVPSAAFIKVQLERWLVKREAALAEANYGIVDLPEVDTPSSERKTAHKASLIDIMHDVSTGLTD